MGQKTFYPGISIKTLENLRSRAGNHNPKIVTAQMPLLEELRLAGNDLSGTIPSELGNLPRVWRFHLYQNQLSGTIPSELANLPRLEELYLDRNNLSGMIPSELGNLTVLEEFYVSDNVLEGPVPTQILESLADKSLLELALWGNDRLNWTGISDKLLKRVERAALSIFSEASGRDNWTKTNNWRNSFTFSDWYGVRTDSDGRVITLKLDNNNLRGEISDSLRGLARLKRLVLRQNKLSGAIPPELGDLTGLTHLLLGENQLRGAIPSELGDLTGLLALGLSDNELSCDIPDLSPLSQLLDLKLQNNYQLGGTLEMGLTAGLYDLNTSCTAIETPGITPPIIDCMGTVPRGSLSFSSGFPERTRTCRTRTCRSGDTS